MHIEKHQETPTGLLIIDVQSGFINEHTEKILKQVENLQGNYDTVFATRFFNKPDSLYRKVLDWHEMAIDDPGFALAFRPRADVVVFDKSTYSCVDKVFVSMMKKRGIKHVDVCGIDTDACVLRTAMDLLDAGIAPRVLADCCASTGGKAIHRAALKILRRNLGERQVVQSSFPRITLSRSLLAQRKA